MKAVCVLEAILRKRDDEQFSIVASYFSENKDLVIRCTESPQSSLREKSTKVSMSCKYVSGSAFASLVFFTFSPPLWLRDRMLYKLLKT